MASRIGVDIGGTFTDLVFYDDDTGALLVEKVPTTPANPEQGCINAVRQAIPGEMLRKSAYFLHGTTVGLNALLERRGATVGLITTAGFRDVLEIGRGSRGQPYNLMWAPQPPLVPRRLRLSIRERTYADGTIALPPDEQDVQSNLRQFESAGVTAIAVVFINAYANPENELAVETMLRKAGFSGAISLSHRVSGEYGEYERTSTAVVDAFVRARMAGYLDLIESELVSSGFKGGCLLTRSGSGSMSFAEGRERPFETIMSGPVAGAEGASELSRVLKLGDLITADVGGTSFDTCVILNGKPQLQFQGEIAGMPLQATWVDVRSIGAGGGSVAYVDSGGGLKVGPRSSGAVPGPACYGRGGSEPCVTDAAFYLGMLGDGKLASGLRLNRALCEQALQSVSQPLNYTVEQTARGIIEIVTASMANAIREITIEQGLDPRAMKLLPFGGAGPLLATQLARELDIREVIVPPHAGNFSAWGLLGANIARSASATLLLPLEESALPEIARVSRQLFQNLDQRRRAAAVEEFRELTLDMRYAGQEHTLSVPLRSGPDGLLTANVAEVRSAFEEVYTRSYGGALHLPVEIATVRVSIKQPLPRRKVAPPTGAPSKTATVALMSAASFATGTWSDFKVLARGNIQPGEAERGPAIIQEPTTTTYVDSDFTFQIDENSCLRLRRV
jgi:N-methylhydantoinase A